MYVFLLLVILASHLLETSSLHFYKEKSEHTNNGSRGYTGLLKEVPTESVSTNDDTSSYGKQDDQERYFDPSGNMENVNVTTRLNTNNTSRLIYDRRLHQKNEDILIISKPVRRYSQHVLDVINIKYVVKKEPEVKVNEIRSRITFSRPKERSRREDRDHEITLSSFNISKNTLNVSVRHLSHSFSPGGTDVGGGGVNTVALTYDNNLSSSPASSEAVVKEYSTEVFKSRETS
ncbi:uncharacterized protein LOC143224662 isoform X2 [Tachypleus tridentatus]|uniref:uncharacterized protein LOC143224662 isoform X2 n=1 Tax=Tachypleus tridentatus TaxID=6853 RepID=UPI003FD2E7D0